MNHLPPRIRQLVDDFDMLPGIGPKHAARLAFQILNDKERGKQFADDLNEALASVMLCRECQTIAENSLCEICGDKKRDQSVICVVAHVQDVEPLERTGKHTGTYHILHGMVSPLEGITPDHLTVKALLDRVKKNMVQEVILALDLTSEGEATMLYLTKILKDQGINVSKLARGIPMGSNIEYTDEVTLSSAFEDRKKM